jgi:hypothetical protein
MPLPPGVFCPCSVVRFFVRIGSCCVFHLSTKELHRGKESKEGEEEGQKGEEEVVSSFAVSGCRSFAGDATLRATHKFGGWSDPAAISLRDIPYVMRERPWA